MNVAQSPDLPEPGDLDELIGNQYEVSQLIGSGGMGAVYLANQAGLNRLVAIKILPEIDDDQARERFQEEARNLARCNHPNIVAVYDSGETSNGIPYLVMEHVAGGSLEEVIESGDKAEEDLDRFAMLRQICDGLAYAHAKGMAHLDIKPANLLLTANQQVKISDFGLARIVAGGDNNPVGGTPLYAAPEVGQGEQGIDSRADIYSLGVVIYRWLTGKYPRGMFMPPSQVDSSIPEAFDSLVGLALKKNSDSRYQTIGELESDLIEIYLSNPELNADSASEQTGSVRDRFITLSVSLMISQLIGGIFNSWYNKRYIVPRFFEGESFRFIQTANTYYLVAFGVLLLAWSGLIYSVYRLPAGDTAAKRRVVNLPWWAALMCAVGWLGAIAGIGIPLKAAGGSFISQLSGAILIGTTISVSQAFLIVDLLSQKLLYPHFFSQSEKIVDTPGAFPLSLPVRGLLWTLSCGLCPVLAVLLIVSEEDLPFAVGVSLACIGFGLIGGWLLTRLIVDPIKGMSQAAAKVGSGDLTTRVGLFGADELGLLGFEFNRMVKGLRERKYIREKIGKMGKAPNLVENPVPKPVINDQGVVLMLVIETKGASAEARFEQLNHATQIFRDAVDRFGCLAVASSVNEWSAAFAGDQKKKVDSCAKVVAEQLDSVGISHHIVIETGEVLIGVVSSGASRLQTIAGEAFDRARKKMISGEK